MIKKLFHAEGPVIGLLDTAGRLIVLSILWIGCCIPIVTVASANAALYYSVVKSIRLGQGSAVQEFLKSFRGNLRRGIPISIGIAALGALLAVNFMVLQGQGNTALSLGNLIVLLLLGFFLIYVGPVLSRFRMGAVDAAKLTFVMAIRFLPYSVLIALGAAVCAAVQIFLLPIPTVLILPGCVCLLVTFPMEKALRKYMPPKQEDDNAWYYET